MRDTCVYTYIDMYIHIHMHTCIPANTHTHTYTHTDTHTCMHTHIHVEMHTDVHRHRDVHMPSYVTLDYNTLHCLAIQFIERWQNGLPGCSSCKHSASQGCIRSNHCSEACGCCSPEKQLRDLRGLLRLEIVRPSPLERKSGAAH